MSGLSLLRRLGHWKGNSRRDGGRSWRPPTGARSSWCCGTCPMNKRRREGHWWPDGRRRRGRRV